MYAYIRGTLEETLEELVVVENRGIGYQIHVPLRVLEELPPRGSEVRLYTYLYIREDQMSLFGFLSRDEKALFQLLLNVSGIGPKGALGILSVLSADDIRFAIVSEDVKTLSKAPGIGSKTAKRLIIELKDKVDLDEMINGSEESGAALSVGNNQVRSDAAQALTALGYSAADAARVLAGIEISEESDVEDVLRQALKRMALL